MIPVQYEYGWVDKNGMQNMLGKEEERAIRDAKRMDADFPEEAPHKVIRYSLDSGYIAPPLPPDPPLPPAPLCRFNHI